MPKSPTYRQRLGAHGETLAEEFLLREGYQILGKNFSKRAGELDLIAEKDGEIAFVEVKLRTSQKYGTASEAVTRTKLKKLREVAWQWLEENNRLDASWRLDLVALDKVGNNYELKHFPYLE